MNIFYPIQLLANLFSYNLLGLAKNSYLANTINFFIYDTIKIGLLLLIINFIMAGVNYYFPMEKARDILTKKRWFGINYLMAALLGIVTPFCSC
ncbi:MAG: permease, partial [Patescibacteria group bacterium]